jgi:hypothetical protein
MFGNVKDIFILFGGNVTRYLIGRIVSVTY